MAKYSNIKTVIIRNFFKNKFQIKTIEYKISFMQCYAYIYMHYLHTFVLVVFHELNIKTYCIEEFLNV